MSTRVRGVEVLHWNPRRSLLPGYLPRTTRVNNFGDLLGPVVVDRLAPRRAAPPGAPRLVSVGSILHRARDGDVVWGSGLNGKEPADSLTVGRLDVRAVRGPITAEALRRRGIRVPDVYGDPGLLVPALLGVTRQAPDIAVTSIPNLNDLAEWRGRPGFLSPRTPYAAVIERISRSERVVASSLHALVIAEVLGVPVSPVRPRHEPVLKYQDYFEGTGRSLPRLAESFEDALDAPLEPLVWSGAALRAAFPRDLWLPEAAGLPPSASWPARPRDDARRREAAPSREVAPRREAEVRD